MSSLSSLIKRSLHKYTFLALSSYSALASHQVSWDSLITRRADRSANELRDGLNSLRGVCLRSFPEFLADLKLAALGKGGELGTGLADFTVSVREVHLLSRGSENTDTRATRLSDTWSKLSKCRTVLGRHLSLLVTVTGRWARVCERLRTRAPNSVKEASISSLSIISVSRCT